MKAKTLIVGIVSDRIDLLLLQGRRVVDSRRIAVALDSDAERWGKTVRDTAKAVRSAAAELGAIGASAIVCYRNHSECSEYANVRVKSRNEAEQAAVLSCADALSCPLDAAVCKATTIAAERDRTQPKTHVIVAADSDNAVSAIAAMIAEAGLKFASATPIDAALMVRAAREATADRSPAAARLHIGEHRSFFIIMVGGRVAFARPIAVGTDTLASALTRAIRVSPGAEPIELSLDSARTIIHRYGFPKRDQVVHDQLQLTGSHIIPLLQPVMQRYVVELRQSLRFALPEDQRQSVPFTISGSGAGLPGFASVIADELKVKVVTDRAAEGQPEGQSVAGDLAEACADRSILQRLGLQPITMNERNRMRHLQRWMWTGAAAAIAVIAMDGARYNSRLTASRRQADAIASHTSNLEVLQTTGSKLLGATEAMSKLEGLIDKNTATRADFGMHLHELSKLTPETIRLTQVGFSPTSTSMEGRLSGFALGEGEQSRPALEQFIAVLRKSPLVKDAALMNVSSATLREQHGQRFDLSFTVIEAPVAPAIASAASPNGVATP